MSRIVLEPDSSYRPCLMRIPNSIAFSDHELVELDIGSGHHMAYYLGVFSAESNLKAFLHTESAADVTHMPDQTARVISPALQRVRARQPGVIRRARELRSLLGDPVAGLARVLQNVPVENDTWDGIAQEPYG